MSSPIVGGKKRRTTKKSGLFGLGLMSKLFGKTKKVKKSKKSRKSRKSKKSRRMYRGGFMTETSIQQQEGNTMLSGGGGVRYYPRKN